MRCLMRCAAARRVQPRRWSIVHRRFVSDPLAAVRAGSDFYFDLATMLPKVPVDIFDLESRAWSHCVPAFGICVRGSCLVLRPTFAACLGPMLSHLARGALHVAVRHSPTAL